MPRDEFTAEAFFKGFTEGWKEAGGDETVGDCPVPEPHFDEVEYLIDQVKKAEKQKYLSLPCLCLSLSEVRSMANMDKRRILSIGFLFVAREKCIVWRPCGHGTGMCCAIVVPMCCAVLRYALCTPRACVTRVRGEF